VGKLNITVITTDRSSSIKAAMRWWSLFYLLSFDVNMYFPPPPFTCLRLSYEYAVVRMF
jgi:hypothetical protein